MNLWMSSEWSGSQAFGHDMRTARNDVELKINEVITSKTYDLPLIKIRLVLILMEDPLDLKRFCETNAYNKRQKIAEFGLQLDYTEFQSGDHLTKQSMIFALILRSLDFLEEKGLNKTALDELRQDIYKVALENDWVKSVGMS